MRVGSNQVGVMPLFLSFVARRRGDLCRVCRSGRIVRFCGFANLVPGIGVMTAKRAMPLKLSESLNSAAPAADPPDKRPSRAGDFARERDLGGWREPCARALRKKAAFADGCGAACCQQRSPECSSARRRMPRTTLFLRRHPQFRQRRIRRFSIRARRQTPAPIGKRSTWSPP